MLCRVFVCLSLLAGAKHFSYPLAWLVDICLIAIDEAHCVSKWGHDFRPAYRSLIAIRRYCPSVPLVALTATATPKVREDIARTLELKNALHANTGFDRLNLYLSVGKKTGSHLDFRPFLSEKPGSTAIHKKWDFDGPTIIYCTTRKEVEEVAGMLQRMGVNCVAYHAGLSPADRRDAQSDFMVDKVSCVVATVAFGMGINKVWSCQPRNPLFCSVLIASVWPTVRCAQSHPVWGAQRHGDAIPAIWSRRSRRVCMCLQWHPTLHCRLTVDTSFALVGLQDCRPNASCSPVTRTFKRRDFSFSRAVVLPMQLWLGRCRVSVSCAHLFRQRSAGGACS